MEEVFIVICNLCVPEFTIRSIELVYVCVRACERVSVVVPTWVKKLSGKNYYNALLC